MATLPETTTRGLPGDRRRGAGRAGRDVTVLMRPSSAAGASRRTPQVSAVLTRVRAAAVGPPTLERCAATSASCTTSRRPRPHDEVRAAALQYVRKVSGSTRPSQANAAAFARAVDEVAAATQRLLERAGDDRPAEGPRGRGGQGPGPLPGPVRPGRLTAGSPGSAGPRVTAGGPDNGVATESARSAGTGVSLGRSPSWGGRTGPVDGTRPKLSWVHIRWTTSALVTGLL